MQHVTRPAVGQHQRGDQPVAEDDAGDRQGAERPTIQALRVNGLAGGRKQTTAGVLAGVAVTTAGGVLLSWLRERSGSLAAPALLHLAANCGGPVAAWAVADTQRSKATLPDTSQPIRAL
jgi:Type II CAAX prenyl endopeptidase Rce1-like